MTNGNGKNRYDQNNPRPSGIKKEEFGLAPDAFPPRSKKSNRRREDLTARLKNQKPALYDVGYAKPPVATRFQKGRSGNPCGRPPGALSVIRVDSEARQIRSIILEEGNRLVSLSEDDKSAKVPVKAALMKKIIAQAMDGDSKSIKIAMALISSAESSKQQEELALLSQVLDYKDEWEKIKKIEALYGREPDTPYPHPDHIHIDTLTGQVEFRGPMHEDELPRYHRLWEQRKKLSKTANLIIKRLMEEKDPSIREKLEHDYEKVIDSLSKAIQLLGDWRPQAEPKKK